MDELDKKILEKKRDGRWNKRKIKLSIIYRNRGFIVFLRNITTVFNKQKIEKIG